MTEANNNRWLKWVRWLFIATLISLILPSALLQYYRPEWFLLQELELGELPKKINDTLPPEKRCDIYGCQWYNVPAKKPYVVQTGWGWLYTQRTNMILVLFIVGILVNIDKANKWKSMFLK